MDIRISGLALSDDYGQRGGPFYPVDWVCEWPARAPRPWFVFDPSAQPPEWQPEILSAEEDAELRRILGTADS